MTHAIARDGEEILIRIDGQDWLSSWHPAEPAPLGQSHGAAGICVTEDGEIVLVSHDGSRWDIPAGRPEGDETWEQTLRREVLEEACATVREARLLGFYRSACVAGRQAGLVLVRSFWRAEVLVEPWVPRFEIAARRLVSAAELLSHLPPPYLPLLRRALVEAAVLSPALASGDNSFSGRSVS
jgi:8-oxo-dGTP pyrophosphatase MutT (NUDIX family)